MLQKRGSEIPHVWRGEEFDQLIFFTRKLWTACGQADNNASADQGQGLSPQSTREHLASSIFVLNRDPWPMFRAKLDRTVTKFIWANFKAAIVQKIIVQIFMKHRKQVTINVSAIA